MFASVALKSELLPNEKAHAFEIWTVNRTGSKQKVTALKFPIFALIF